MQGYGCRTEWHCRLCCVSLWRASGASHATAVRGIGFGASGFLWGDGFGVLRARGGLLAARSLQEVGTVRWERWFSEGHGRDVGDDALARRLLAGWRGLDH